MKWNARYKFAHRDCMNLFNRLKLFNAKRTSNFTKSIITCVSDFLFQITIHLLVTYIWKQKVNKTYHDSYPIIISRKR